MPIGVLTETMVRGSTHKFRIEVYNELTLALTNISAWLKFWSTLKALKTETDPGELQLTSPASGITIIDAANGLIEVTIADTFLTAAPGITTHYYIDVKGEDDTSRHWTLAMGRLTVQADVTRATV